MLNLLRADHGALWIFGDSGCFDSLNFIYSQFRSIGRTTGIALTCPLLGARRKGPEVKYDRLAAGKQRSEGLRGEILMRHRSFFADHKCLKLMPMLLRLLRVILRVQGFHLKDVIDVPVKISLRGWRVVQTRDDHILPEHASNCFIAHG